MRNFLAGILMAFPFVAPAQVELTTGSPEFSIPLYSYADNKSGLSLTTALVYAPGNGIKVSQPASSTGLGWNLVCGGVIVRKQSDLPDDQHRVNGDQYYPYLNYTQYATPETRWLQKYIYGDGYMYNAYSSPCPKDVAYSPQWSTPVPIFKPGMDALADREQDEFMFSFNGESGSFIIGKNAQVVKINDSRLIIQPLFETIPEANVRTTISGFKIIAENGVIYYFKKYELNETCDYEEYERKCTRYDGTLEPSCGTFARFVLSKVKAYPLNQFVISKWYLSEMENPVTHEKILFNYSANDLDYIDELLLSGKENGSKFTISRTEQRVISKGWKIHEVIFPDQRKIEFIYQNLSRIDLDGDKALSSIKIYYNNSLQFDYNLSYGYFYKTEIKPDGFAFTTEDKKHTRLCLTKIQKFSPIATEQPYTFSYNMHETVNMAPRLSNFRSKDYWGYFNYYYVTFNGQFDEEGITQLSAWENLLKTEDMRFYISDFSKIGMLRQVKYPLGGTLDYEYEYNICNNTNSGCIVIGAGGVRVSQIKTTAEVDEAPIIRQYKYVKADGVTSSAWGYETPVYSRQGNLRQYKTPYALYTGRNATDFTQAALESLHLRYENMPYQSSALPFAIQKFASVALSIAIDYLIYFFQDDYKDFTITDYEMYPYNLQNPLPFQYSRVEVIDKKGASNVGKTVYEHRSDTDVSLVVPTFSYPFSSKQRALNWQYGLPKTVSYFDDLNRLVKQVIYEYADVNSTQNTNHFYNIKSAPLRIHAAENGNFDYTGISTTDIASDSYYYTSGRTNLVKTTEKTYSLSGSLMETITEFIYNADYLVKSSKRTNSNGDKRETVIYYTNDYNSISPAIGALKANNIISVPISTETWVHKNTTPPSEKTLISATVNEYGLTATGEAEIITTYQFESPTPVGVSAIGEMNPAVLIRDANYFKSTSTREYDNDGNLFRVTTPGGRTSSFIYDYNKRLMIASVLNDNEGKSAYTSFEVDGTGNWQFNAPSLVSGQSVTGLKCYQLFNPSTGISYPVTRGTLSAGSTYTVTLWAKQGSSIQVNGVVPDIIYQNTEWVLYKRTFTGMTTVTIQGTGLIDEVRLFPALAQMRTTVYDPALGLQTSACDVNNVITYYEYDSFGRLILVRDADKNVIKTYEYNTK